MTLAELAEQTKLPREYVLYLFTIIDGTETQYIEEDALEAEKLEDQLCLLSLDEDDE